MKLLITFVKSLRALADKVVARAIKVREDKLRKCVEDVDASWDLATKRCELADELRLVIHKKADDMRDKQHQKAGLKLAKDLHNCNETKDELSKQLGELSKL